MEREEGGREGGRERAREGGREGGREGSIHYERCYQPDIYSADGMPHTHNINRAFLIRVCTISDHVYKSNDIHKFVCCIHIYINAHTMHVYSVIATVSLGSRSPLLCDE